MMPCLSLRLSNVLNGTALKNNQARAMVPPTGGRVEYKYKGGWKEGQKEG